MAVTDNTVQTYDRVGNREDLEDVIYNITPEETPFTSMIGSTNVKATRHDWQTDELETPDASNQHVEGDNYEYEERGATARLANYTQISRRSVIVSETQDAVDQAGRSRELAYQMSKVGVELRRDNEAAMLSNVGSNAGATGSARVSAGFPAWLETNTNRESGGSDGGWNASTGLVEAASNGSQRTFTKALMDDVIQQAYESGGNPTVVMLSPANKRAFSAFMSDSNVAPFRYNYERPDTKQGIVLAAADTYVSDFGTMAILPNRVMGTSDALGRNVFVVQPDMVKRGVLRPIKQVQPAKTGDAERRVLITEWTLVVSNEAAHGIIADVETTFTAS